MGSRDTVQRSILPIPDKQHVGVTTYDAKDPDTKFPPIEPLRRPTGAPNVLIVPVLAPAFQPTTSRSGRVRVRRLTVVR